MRTIEQLKNVRINCRLPVKAIIGMRLAALHKYNKHRKQSNNYKFIEHRQTHLNAAILWKELIKDLDDIMFQAMSKEEFDLLALPMVKE